MDLNFRELNHNTGSGILHSHHSHQCTHDWISTYDANDINIMATSIQEILVKYQSSQGQEHPNPTSNKACKPYSREAFVGVLVEFIVAPCMQNWL